MIARASVKNYTYYVESELWVAWKMVNWLVYTILQMGVAKGV